MPDQRPEAISAYHVLNHLVDDLVAATRVRDVFQSPVLMDQLSNSAAGCLNRMCLSYLFLTRVKWTEFYDRFHRVIPDDCRPECKALLKEIERRKLKQFRNTVVGHIWDKKKGRVLAQEKSKPHSKKSWKVIRKPLCVGAMNPLRILFYDCS